MSNTGNPFADYAQEQPEAKQTASTQTGAQSGNPFADYATEPETMETAFKGVPGKGTPDNPFQGVIQFAQKISEAREVGKIGFRESALGHAVMSGRLSLEDAEKQIAADDKYAELSADLEKYEKESALPWLTGIAIESAKQLPMLEENLKVGSAGFATGAGGTALASGGLNAPIAIPIGGMTGAAAAGGWSVDFIQGQDYLQFRRAGVSHEVAEPAAKVSGLIQGIFQGLQFTNVAKVPVTAGKNLLFRHADAMAKVIAEKSANLPAAVAKGLHLAGELGKFELAQVTIAEAQTITRQIAQAIAATVDKKPDAVPTLEQAYKEWAETLDKTIKGSLGMFVGGKALGTAGGFALKPIVQKAVETHMENQQAKLQKIKEQAAKQAEKAADKSADTNAGNEPADSNTAGQTPGPSKNALERQRQAEARLEKRVAAENEIRRIFAAAQSKYVIETDETRLQETNRIQRLIKRMVKNSDKLDDAMKAKLLGRITEIDGVAALLKQGDKLIEDMRGREHANELAAAQGKLEKAIKSGQPKEGRAKLPPAAQATLKFFDEFFDEPEVPKDENAPKRQPGEAREAARQAALKKATDYVDKGNAEEAQKLQDDIDKLDKGELAAIFNQPAELAEKKRVAMLAQQYYSGNMDAAAITKLAGEIQEIVKTGKSEFLERKQAEAKRLLQLRARVLEGIQGKKPVVPSQADTAPKKMSGIGKVVNSIRTTSSRLWDKLLQDSDPQTRATIVNDILDFTKVENEEAAINIRAAEKMASLYTKAVGSLHEATRLIRDGAKNEKFDVSYTDSDGNAQTLGRFTLNELAYLHLAMEDPGAIPGLVHGNKYTLEGMVEAGQTSTQEAIRQVLTQRAGGKYLKLAGAVRDFYRWFAPEIHNHYLKEYGVTLPMDENYSGQIFHRQIERLKSGADILNNVHDVANRSLSPGSTKARSNSTLPVKAVDPFDQVQRHRAEMAFWIANSEKARQDSFIFSDSSKDGLRDVVSHKLGKEYMSMIDQRLAFQYHLKPGIMDIGDAAWSGLKGNMATGFLGARIDQAPKQWTSILAALAKSNYAEFSEGLKKAGDPKELSEYLSRSQLFKDRQSHILPQILEATKERTFVDAVTKDRALDIKTFFLTPMHKWGDGVGAAVSGFIEYNRALKHGATKEEAALAGDRLVDQTQSSSRPSQKVPAEMKGGIAAASLSFAKEGIQAINRESGAIRDWVLHPDKNNAARMVRIIIATHVAQTLFQAINTTPAWIVGDDKEKEAAAARIGGALVGGSYGTLPLIGWDVVGGAMSGFKGEQEPRTIIGGITSDTAKTLKYAYTIVRKMAEGEEIDGEDWTHAFQSAAATASVKTGIPFWGMFKYTNLGSKVVEKAQGGGE